MDLTSEVSRILEKSAQSHRTMVSIASKDKHRVRWRWLAGASLLALVVIMGTNVGSIRRILSGGKVENPISSLAILPLDNMMENPSEQEYFVAGMHEALVAELSKISSIDVISRTSTLRYKGAGVSLPRIADELNVDAIIEGSVLKSGNRVRITVQLIDGRTDGNLWSESYTRELEDIFSLHSDIAWKVAKAIEAEVTPDEIARIQDSSLVNPAAHDAWLRGWYLVDTHQLDNFVLAESLYRRELKLDETFAPAYAGLGILYSYFADEMGLDVQEQYVAVKESCERALALDENLADAHHGMACFYYLFDWNWSLAESEFRRALELNPNSAHVRIDYAEFLSCMGRHEDALHQVYRARKLAPLNPHIDAQVGYAHYYAHDMDKAFFELQRTLAIDPSHARVHTGLGRALLQQGRCREALTEFRTADELTGAGLSWLTVHAHALLGDAGAARRFIANTGRPVEKAVVYLALGEKEKALDWLERAVDVKHSYMSFIKVDRLWNPLWNEL
jgi:TolB-like protein/Tfp pilus assembly protein PilF